MRYYQLTTRLILNDPRPKNHPDRARNTRTAEFSFPTNSTHHIPAKNPAKAKKMADRIIAEMNKRLGTDLLKVVGAALVQASTDLYYTGGDPYPDPKKNYFYYYPSQKD